MNIRNVLEETVFHMIDEVIQEDLHSGSARYTSGEQCRTDAACYVLNRLPPRYVSSARGQAHAEKESRLNPQLDIDIMTLVHEGLRRVTTVQRSYYSTDGSAATALEGAYYHFPIIKGRLLHGLSFEPISKVSVVCTINSEKAVMIDANWENPYPVAEQSNGTYAFWPCPLKAQPDQPASLDFLVEIQVHDDRFEPLRHSFSLDILRRETAREDLISSHDYRLPDMYLIPRE